MSPSFPEPVLLFLYLALTILHAASSRREGFFPVSSVPIPAPAWRTSSVFISSFSLLPTQHPGGSSAVDPSQGASLGAAALHAYRDNQ